nr:ABC transporter ATP-binding protein [Verrucomicrobiaceae bacterium]
MSDPIIKVDGLAKRYLVGHQSEREQYQSLRDTIVRSGKNFVRKAVDMAKGRQILMGDEVEE